MYKSLRRNGLALIVNKKFWNAVLGCKLKNKRMVLVCFQGESFNIAVIQVFAPTTKAKEDEVEWFYGDLQDLLELTFKKKKKKDFLFIIGYWNIKVGSQEIPWIASKFGLGAQNEAQQRLIVLSREHAGHSKHSCPTIQETALHMDINRWSVLKSDWVYSLKLKIEKLYIVSKKQDLELTVAQIMSSLLQNTCLNWRK